MARFRWNDWNVEHIANHGVAPAEAEAVVEDGRRERVGDRKYMAKGQTPAGRWLQVAYVFDPPGVVYVIHARPLNEREKRRERRRRR